MTYPLYFLSTKDNEASLLLFFFLLHNRYHAIPNAKQNFYPYPGHFGYWPVGEVRWGEVRWGHTPHRPPTGGGAMSRCLAAMLWNPSALLLPVMCPTGCPAKDEHRRDGRQPHSWGTHDGSGGQVCSRTWGIFLRQHFSLGRFHPTFPSLRVCHCSLASFPVFSGFFPLFSHCHFP